jgi:cell fate regulator YaaT (PSP1 superfamily)
MEQINRTDEAEQIIRIVGIRFRKGRKIYHFDPLELELYMGDYVVVKTTRGLELGQVIIAPKQVPSNLVQGSLKPVIRKAEPEDMQRVAELALKEEDVLTECIQTVAKFKLPMKLLSAEFALDESRLTILFSAAQRVDFRELVRELNQKFKVRVELRQVGPRDETKLIGDFGKCGNQLCCARFLNEFAPVSIRMAKEQNLSLNPMKISGVCGRLMCCLTYEFDQYRSIKEKLPKIGHKVSTSMGDAKVVGINPIKETVNVELESQATVELPLSDIHESDLK